MFWPDLPDSIPVELVGHAGGVALPEGPVELRRVTLRDAVAVEVSVPEVNYAETFNFFTVLPFPVEEFIMDPGRQMYALWLGDRVVASTTVYNGAPGAGTAMLGYTWVAPEYRGRGGGAVNTALKAAMYVALKDAGVDEVWFRADVENLRSCHSMEKNGAERMNIAADPRVYQELPWRPGRVSRSVFYRKLL